MRPSPFPLAWASFWVILCVAGRREVGSATLAQANIAAASVCMRPSLLFGLTEQACTRSDMQSNQDAPISSPMNAKKILIRRLQPGTKRRFGFPAKVTQARYVQ